VVALQSVLSLNGTASPSLTKRVVDSYGSLRSLKRLKAILRSWRVPFYHPDIRCDQTDRTSWRNELEITDAIQKLIESRYIVKHHVIQGWWKDTGMPEDILEVNRLLLDDLVPCVEAPSKRVPWSRAAYRSAADSTKTRECGVWPDHHRGKLHDRRRDVHRPYTSIGDNTHVSGAHIEDSIVIGDSVITCKETIVEV